MRLCASTSVLQKKTLANGHDYDDRAQLFWLSAMIIVGTVMISAGTLSALTYPAIQLSSYQTIQLSNYRRIELSNYRSIEVSKYCSTAGK